jgi:phage terminase large subunit
VRTQEIQFPRKFEPLVKQRAKAKVIHGGRGGGKSWSVARALVLLGVQRKIRVLCTRETQKSMRDSVHRLLVDQIAGLGLAAFYDIKQVQITSAIGSTFTFMGLSDQTAASLKSFEKADICWVEEAHTVSDYSWTILLPTLYRSSGEECCELWITFNPELDTDPTWKLFVESQPFDDVIRVEMNYRDNPWFPEDLDKLRLHDQATRPLYEYEWIWEGKCKPAISGAVYADQMAELFAGGRVTDVPVDAFAPVFAVFDLGWNDATAIVLCQRHLSSIRIIDYIEDSHKTLDWYSKQLIDKPYTVQELFLPHDGAHDHLTGQSAQRTLEDLNWRVSILPNQPVEDGIRALRMAFKSLYIDKKCVRLIECMKRYRRLIPATTREPSKPCHDEFSHGADALRYTALAAPDMHTHRTPDGGLKLPALDFKYSFKGY